MEQLLALLESIDDSPQNVVYISIGCGANPIYDEITCKHIVKKQLCQQIPPFLENLMEKLNFHFHIILIDPKLENPPYCTSTNATSDGLWYDDRQLDNGWIHNNNIYHKQNTTIYTFREFVKYPPYHTKPCYDFENHMEICGLNMHTFFVELNNRAMRNGWFVVMHDYTGREMEHVANFYDKQLNEHISHIFYGLCARFSGGCFIDLTNPMCQFSYKLCENHLSAFNPWLDLHNKQLSVFFREYAINKTEMMDMLCVYNQIIIYVDININHLVDDISCLRRAKLRKDGQDVRLDSYEITKYTKDTFGELNMSKLYDFIFEHAQIEFRKILYMCGQEGDLERIILENDCYKWIENVKKQVNLGELYSGLNRTLSHIF